MVEPEKIEPCPFCGRTQHTGLAFTRRTRGRDDFPTHRVECACGACGSSYPSQREAISAWNRIARSVALALAYQNERRIAQYDSSAFARELCARFDATEKEVAS